MVASGRSRANLKGRGGGRGRGSGRGRGRGSSRGRARNTMATKRTVQTPAFSYSPHTENDPLVIEFQHDKAQPREAEALLMLRKVASLVKPVMRNRGWKIHRLCEFHTPHLLGLNQRYGSNIKIFLRLRHNGDPSQFLSLDQVTDTMLHELAHIVVGPHNSQFHALWNQLRDELTELVMKGYTGEGFLSRGQRLGGGLARVPIHEARRRAAAAAQRRQTLSAGSGRRLGGTPVEQGADMREIIAGAVERRLAITQGCASGTVEGDQIAEDATRRGSTTKAEEDEANERAIAEALADLMKEDEKPALNRSGTLDGFVSRKPIPRTTNVVSPGLLRPRKSSLNSDQTGVIDLTDEPSTITGDDTEWVCNICTLRNPSQYLACDACGSERPKRPAMQTITEPPARHATSEPPFGPQPPAAAAAVPSLTRKSPQDEGQRPRRSAPATPDRRALPSPKPELSMRKRALQSLKQVEESLSSRPMGWLCPNCNTFMEKEWWSCMNCGTVKASS